ncbi:response regulator transcription factor [Paenibacillus prosopidis]|uniref:Two-component system response regulator YesN n=1 Tax=Paenibacillus prosopidis TaxID=630520 RepID=A0A368VL31_9BACL|nr:response regulator [Paenibacillus prosopidis]RCW42238.1 two-component system response regulator YesN [Paenibacillus prosopidis]
MYKLLVVDDEKWVRQGLSLTIDWMAEGIELIGEAEDGEEALQRIQTDSPDIIITDIKMPRMDGLDLIEALRHQQKKAYVIIISGYNDFEYAQKALKYGAYDYVLKPIEETVLLEVVRRCVNDLEQDNKRHRQLKEMSGRIRESLPLARQHFLEMLLLGRIVDPLGDLEARWQALNMTLDPNCLTVLVVKIHHWGTRATREKDRSLIRLALGNIAEEIMMSWGQAAACPLDNNADTELAVLFSRGNFASGKKNDTVDAFSNGMIALVDAAQRYLGITISIGISREGNLVKVAQCFEEALNACSLSFYDGFGKVYDAARLPMREKKLQAYIGPDGSWETRLIQAMKQADNSAVNEPVEQLIEHLQAARDQSSPLDVSRGLRVLLQSVAKRWEAAHPFMKAPGIDVFNETILNRDFTLTELREQLPDALLQCAYESRGTGNHKRIVELGMHFSHQHYMEGITMNDVAEHLYLNPSYFSKVFHGEVGETYSKYLTRLRMNKAKHLLKTSTLKVYEIAEKVGYADFRHFSKTFKELEGMTPGKYRDLGI